MGSRSRDDGGDNGGTRDLVTYLSILATLSPPSPPSSPRRCVGSSLSGLGESPNSKTLLNQHTMNSHSDLISLPQIAKCSPCVGLSVLAPVQLFALPGHITLADHRQVCPGCLLAGWLVGGRVEFRMDGDPLGPTDWHTVRRWKCPIG